jgi:hypothetical protein
LQTVNPELAKEWHPVKNGDLNPKNVTSSSGKKVWWQCEKGHEWQSTIDNRRKGKSCPYCSGRAVNHENCLQTVKPSLATEWNYKKNKNITPEDVSLFSNQKVWWICEKKHEWKARIASRAKGSGCPYCSNKKVCEDNCLLTINPNLASEWHPTKNGELTPRDVVPNSHKKVWWICHKGHEWETSVGHRSRGRGCPSCHSQATELELRIFSEMKYLFEEVLFREKINGIECDIYLPKIRFGIEVDGEYWHRHKCEADKTKVINLRKEGVQLLRVREKGLPKISSDDVFFSPKNIGFDLLKRIVENILKKRELSDFEKDKCDNYLGGKKIKNEKEFLKLLDLLPSPLPGFSLFDHYGEISREWHQEKNGTLTPKDVTPKSAKKVWWKCAEGHEWKAYIYSRTNGNNCPFCSGKKVCEDNCLQTVNPKLASEWHPIKNENLTPKDLTSNARKKVWWLCRKGHEWDAWVY